MITNITTDKATIILPITEEYIDYHTYENLNRNLGAYVLAEIDYYTDSFTKFDIDYSLVEYDDVKDAEQEAQQVYKYMLEYFGITETVDPNRWTQEKIAYLQNLHQEYVDAWGADDELTQKIQQELNLALAA